MQAALPFWYSGIPTQVLLQGFFFAFFCFILFTLVRGVRIHRKTIRSCYLEDNELLVKEQTMGEPLHWSGLKLRSCKSTVLCRCWCTSVLQPTDQRGPSCDSLPCGLLSQGWWWWTIFGICADLIMTWLGYPLSCLPLLEMSSEEVGSFLYWKFLILFPKGSVLKKQNRNSREFICMSTLMHCWRLLFSNCPGLSDGNRKQEWCRTHKSLELEFNHHFY